MKAAALPCSFVALLFARAATAQDHLEPENSVYQGRVNQDDILLGYERDVVRKFGETFNGEFAARAIIIHAFDTEYAVAISRNNRDPFIIGLKASEQLYAYWWLKSVEDASDQNTKKAARDLSKQLPPSINDVELARCQSPISAEDREVYLSLWEKMLRSTRFSEMDRFGLDGITYHFSGEFGFQWPAGQVWRPEPGSVTGRFAQIAETLYSACATNDTSKLSIARDEALALCEELDCGE